MKKINLIGIFVIFLTLTLPNVVAYVNCSTSLCSSGYTDNGEVCQGSTCTRNCTRIICGSTWTEVLSSTFGWDVIADDEQHATSTSHTPTDATFCYNFSYKGPPATDPEIRLLGSTNPSFDCDAEMIGGFRQGGGQSNPWFNGMNNFVGPQTNTQMENMRQIVRAHAEEDSDQTYRNNAAGSGSIYCAPNSYACGLLGGTAVCDIDCYNKSSEGKALQGYYKDKGTPDQTLYDGANCGGFTDANEYDSATFKVSEVQTTFQHDDQSCDRIHEAPSASGILVLPQIPNTGQDLLCNYTYSDPENFTEQNSSYEWWKNGVNQNVNSQILSKTNLTPGNQWYCKVTPSDGLLFGTQVQSINTVTIRNATQSPILFAGNNAAWNYSGYFGVEENIIDFNQELSNALGDCAADNAGYCNISLTFSSSNVGTLNLSNIGIYYVENVSIAGNTPPVITAIPDISFNEDSYNDTLNLSDYVSDAQDPDETLIWTSTGNTNIIVKINQTTKKVNFTALANWSGNENIKFTVNDTGNLTSNDTILVTVNAVNDAPTFNLSISNMIWPEDIINNSLNLSKHFYDIDDITLNYTSAGTTDVTVLIDNITGIVTITPNANWSGINYIIFTKGTLTQNGNL